MINSGKLTIFAMSFMKNLMYINKANDFALEVGAEVWHPMVSVIHFDELGEIPHTLNKMGVYAIFVQDNFPTEPTYGMGGYDTSKGSLTAASPGQIIGKADNGHREVYHGWALLFDPEFMRGTVFEQRLTDYHFFSYNVNEALHTTQGEKQVLWQLMERIRIFISHREQTALTDRIVQDYIVLVCDYCLLFYQRQFQTSSAQKSDLLARFHNDSPTRIIQHFLIDRAKSLMIGGMTVSQVADELGFEYPQHFTRYFKKHEGMTPSDYVASMRKQ